MQVKEFIEPPNSLASPVVIVKKGGEIGFCIDNHMLSIVKKGTVYQYQKINMIRVFYWVIYLLPSMCPKMLTLIAKDRTKLTEEKGTFVLLQYQVAFERNTLKSRHKNVVYFRYCCQEHRY